MSENTKYILQAMASLDPNNGGGIFLPQKRKVAEGKGSLFIGFGGTGADALDYVKHSFYQSIDNKNGELQNHVQFLVIDTDSTVNDIPKAEGKELVQGTRFDQGEFHYIGVDTSLQPEVIKKQGTLDQYKSWLDPRLEHALKTDALTLNGKGAGATRQSGRLLLSPAQTRYAFKTAVQTSLNKLLQGTRGELAPDGVSGADIDIYIITGISGGTGSGIVIDGTYLVREAVSETLKNFNNSVSYTGIILLPPTGNSTNPASIKKGNENGYAALKEIDYYMTVSKRGESYDEIFNGVRTHSNENIFNMCYLLDGITGAFYAPAADRRINAESTVASFLLDQVTASSAKLNANDQLSAMQFRTDGADSVDAMQRAAAFLKGNRTNLAPRQVNYKYFTMGTNKAIIPIQLIKARVAFEMFKNMSNLFQKCANVTDKDVKAFVDIVTSKKIISGSYNGRIDECVKGEAYKYYINPSKGPWFTINLLSAASKKIDNSKGLFDDKQLNARVRSAVLKLNNDMFGIFVTIMQTFKSYMQTEAGLLAKSDLIQTYYGSTYSFTPISLQANDPDLIKEGADGIVLQYINSLITNINLKKFTEDFLGAMYKNYPEWTGKDVSIVARDFFDNEMNKFVTNSLEDLLIKIYTGNPGAKITYAPDGITPDAVSLGYLSTAAQTILQNLIGGGGKATPMISLQVPTVAASIGGGGAVLGQKKVVMVPADATNLKAAIENEIQSNPIVYDNVVVIDSYNNESISAAVTYMGIAADMLTWTEDGEADYESAVKAAKIGLHMSMTAGGKNWTDFPNLIPREMYKNFTPEYENPRESSVRDLADEVFKDAEELGLSNPNMPNGIFNSYSLFALPEQFIPDSSLFKAVDMYRNAAGDKAAGQILSENRKKLEADAEAKAQAIYDKIKAGRISTDNTEKIGTKSLVCSLTEFEKLEEINLDTSYHMSYAPGELNDNDTEAVSAYNKKIASAILRTHLTEMYKMRGTVMVLDKVYNKICDSRKEKTLLELYLSCLATGNIEFSESLNTWGFDDVELFEIPYRNDFNEEEIAQFFLMFRRFIKMGSDKLTKLISDFVKTASWSKEADKEMQKEKIQAYSAGMLRLKEKIESYSKPVSFDTPDAPSVYSKKFAVTIRDDERYHLFEPVTAEDVISFYQDIIKLASNLSTGNILKAASANNKGKEANEALYEKFTAALN